MLSAIVDISSRKRLEERFRQVVESAPNAMVMINTSGSIEMVNAQAERVFGYERKELLGQAIEMLVPERFRSNHPGLRGSFFSGPVSRPMGAGRDLYGLKKDGSEFPIEIGLNPIETDEGPMVLSAIVDISSRKKLEERFRQVVESAPNAMVMISQDGNIEMVNAQAERLFGYDRKEMLRQPIEMLVPVRFRANHPGLRGIVLLRPRVAAHGRRSRSFRPEEGRQRIPDRDRPESHRNRRRPDGALGHRRHLGPQAQRAKHSRGAQGKGRAARRNSPSREEQPADRAQPARICNRPTSPMQLALGMMRESQNRIRSMALIHQTLYESKDFARVDFRNFLDSLVPTLVSSYGVGQRPGEARHRRGRGPAADQRRHSLRADRQRADLQRAQARVPDGRARARSRFDLAHDEPDRVVLMVSDDWRRHSGEFRHARSTTTLGLQLVTLLVDQLGGDS